jgi:hypothetical protein
MYKYDDYKDLVISHHGVKGQKWGVKRRVQSFLGQRKQAKASDERAASWKKAYANRASMSDSELKSTLNRINLENQLRMAVNTASPKKVSAGRAFIQKASKDVLAGAISTVGSKYAAQGLELAIKKVVAS